MDTNVESLGHFHEVLFTTAERLAVNTVVRETLRNIVEICKCTWWGKDHLDWLTWQGDSALQCMLIRPSKLSDSIRCHKASHVEVQCHEYNIQSGYQISRFNDIAFRHSVVLYYTVVNCAGYQSCWKDCQRCHLAWQCIQTDSLLFWALRTSSKFSLFWWMTQGTRQSFSLDTYMEQFPCRKCTM